MPEQANPAGEVIVLSGEVVDEGMRLPKERAWTTHLDHRYLGTDVLTGVRSSLPDEPRR